MANELLNKAATGPYNPRRLTASRAGEFVAHLITWHKYHGLTGAQAARLLQGGQP